MLTPYSTDAPIYHLPIGTAGLIAANVVVFALIGAPSMDEFGTPSLADSLCLDYSTVNPVQWVTSIFMHGGILHLVGNMFFLWGFGLVVEGKIGPLRFLPIYFGIGIVQCAFEQVLMFSLGIEGISLGASSVLYGLMGISVLWAPKNSLECIYFISVIPRTAEVPIVVFGGIYVAIELFTFIMSGYSVGSAALHLMGLAVGVPIGLFMLKREMVDCEGWDFLTIYCGGGEQNRSASRRGQRDAEQAKEARAASAERKSRLLEAISQAVEQRNLDIAVQLTLSRMDELQQGKLLPDRALIGVASSLQQKKRWSESIPFLVEMLRRFSDEKTIPTRLKLAQILVQADERPRQAIAVLKKLPPSTPDAEKAKAKQIARIAHKQMKEGAIEIEIHDW